MNSQTNDFFSLYNEKCRDYESLQNELNEMKELGQLIEKELETEVEILTHEKQKIVEKNQELQCKLQELKKNYSSEMSFYERKTDQMEEENTRLKEELKSKTRMVTQNEIEIESLENQLRESQMVICDLECKIDNTLERLAMVQSQFEENRALNEEEVQRLKDRLQESENEVLAYKRREAMMKKFEQMKELRVLTENQNHTNSATNPTKHYGAYQGHGGDDPTPFKQLKVELGKRSFGHINYDANGNQNIVTRAFAKSSYQGSRTQKISGMNQEGGVEGMGRTQGFELCQQNMEFLGGQGLFNNNPFAN